MPYRKLKRLKLQRRTNQNCFQSANVGFICEKNYFEVIQFEVVERLKYAFPSFTSTPMKNTRNGRVQVRQHTSVGCALTDEMTKGTGWLRMYSKFPVNKSQQNTLPSSEPLIICLSEERKQLSILYSLFLWPVNLQ
ncbi:hypothetical protein T05_6634 [Trichinella murrelli]|uniref:Uncharacterized protein n=1 Tax=Trichinella murrelli TaxID=144512 RepID=A0A0V0TM72_9BILA|nr:hypothetical protein T05_6634 [Trichinella murrelli]